MYQILEMEDYNLQKLNESGGIEYEEVTTEKATSIYVTDVAKPKGKLIPFGRTAQGENPSPVNPQEIENVEGRNCRNLFDIESVLSCYPATLEKTITNNILEITSNVTTGSQYVVYKILDLDNIKNYTLSFKAKKVVKGTLGQPKIRCSIYGSNDGTNYTHITNVDVTDPVQGIEYNLAQTLNGYSNYSLYFYNNLSTPVTEGEKTQYYNIMFNEGSTALPYEPYFEGKRLEFNVCNKNWFDGELELGIISGSTGQNSPNSNYIRTTNYQKVEPLTTYKISKENGEGISMYVYEYKEDFSYNLTTAKVVNSTQSFTTETNTKYVRFRTYAENTNVNEKLQLQEGTTATPYEEHKEQLILFPLQEGQKLMEGDYLANDGIHHIMGQIELSGASAETWYKNTDYSTENMLVANLSANNITDMKSGTNKLKCSHFKYASPTTINSFRAIGNVLGFGLDINSFADVNEWKTWLQSNPIIVEYELKEEVVEPYTEAQAEAYNQLMNLMLYKGVNHIWAETDGLEPNLQLTYKRKKQEGVLQVSNIQPLNNLELNNTEETPEEITTEISEE